MSDPFEAFESALGTNDPIANSNDVDPATNFLAEQQAEMAKIENNGFDAFGDFSSVPASNSEVVLSSGFDEEDPYGTTSSVSAAVLESFEHETKTEPENEFTENAQAKDLYSAISTADKLVNEPEKIKTWREEQKKRLEIKDAEEEKKKNEWKDSAKRELDEWYKKRREQLEKKHADNKNSEAELFIPHETEKGKEWEKLGKLCDFNPKSNKNGRDVSRFRSILLQLKQSPLIR